MKYLLIILILFSSCMTAKRAEKKIYRLTKRFPVLLVDDSIKIPKVDIDFTVPLDTKYTYIDSLIINYVEDCDTSPEAVNKLIKDIKDSTINKIVLKDTTIYFDDYTIHIWQNGRSIACNITKPETVILDKDIVIIKPTWWQQWGKWVFWILIIAVILYFCRSFIKELVKKLLSKRLT